MKLKLKFLGAAYVAFAAIVGYYSSVYGISIWIALAFYYGIGLVGCALLLWFFFPQILESMARDLSEAIAEGLAKEALERQALEREVRRQERRRQRRLQRRAARQEEAKTDFST